jgi:threonine synthase
MSLVVNKLKSLGVLSVSEDSSGNAGASLAAYCAAAGMTAEIYVPDYTSLSKVNQIRHFGATVNLVAGDRAAAAAAAQTGTRDSFYAGHSWSPWFDCGVKSLAYELAIQRDGEVPDWIVVPLGGGSLVTGLLKGFGELYRASRVKKIPRLLAVQTSRCAPIYEAWSSGKEKVQPIQDTKPTLAEGVALQNPIRGNQVLKMMNNSDGIITVVDEDEILTAWKTLGRQGLFVEPTSAVALAGLQKSLSSNGTSSIEENHKVVMILTGNGLKTKPELFKNPGLGL